jgi:tetratricopeptide (TPR) repeat protein
VVGEQPADSIIVYATSAGNAADDNPSGRNGLFTTYLLANLKTPGLSVQDIFNKTGADVRQASGGKQIPAIYSQFFEAAYLGGRPAVAVQPAPAPVQPAPKPSPAPQPTRSARSYFDSGDTFRSRGDYDRAIEEYTQAIRLDPNYAAAYNNRGWAYNGKGDYDRGIADCTQAIRLDPNMAAAYNNRGRAYNGKGDYDRAIADYTQAIRIDPNMAAAYNNRGNVYHNNKKDYNRAIADYEAALWIDPNYPYAKTSLENSRKARGW